jgi:hypothetical protein
VSYKKPDPFNLLVLLSVATCCAERLLRKLHPAHYECEDSFYSCPSHPDYIGYDDRNYCSCGRKDVVNFLGATDSAKVTP